MVLRECLYPSANITITPTWHLILEVWNIHLRTQSNTNIAILHFQNNSNENVKLVLNSALYSQLLLLFLLYCWRYENLNLIILIPINQNFRIFNRLYLVGTNKPDMIVTDILWYLEHLLIRFHSLKRGYGYDKSMSLLLGN